MGDFQTDILPVLYPWLKAAHIIFVIFWVAGLFLLPRYYIYHQEAEPGSAEASRWVERERKLRNIILNPAMVIVWVLGIALAVPVALLAARNICRSRVLNVLAQLVLVASRSVNSLVWALIFVAVFGPGAAAGTFAIAAAGAEPVVNLPAEFAAQVREESQRLGALVARYPLD